VSLEQLFENIDASAIHGFVTNRQEEHLQLDFKVSRPEMTRDDRKSLATCLSGFSNSAGGIVVWGVETKRDTASNLDVASRLVPLTSLSAFLGTLRSITPSAVSPMVPGVLHKGIEDGHDVGFAATLVPASDSGPHMAKSGEDRYYRRNGDAFFRMEHFELEDMFGRRPRPELSAFYRIEPGGSNGVIPVARIVVGLRNTGRGTAHHPFLAVSPEPPIALCEFGIDGNYHHGLPKLPKGYSFRGERFGSLGQVVLYPGMDLDVTVCELSVDRWSLSSSPFTIHCSIAADGLPLAAIDLGITDAEILKGSRDVG